jgi:hypothetical protein
MHSQSPTSSLRLRPRAVSLASVHDKPFVAQFVSSAIETDGARSQAEGSLYRDCEARTRCEYRISSGEQLAIISNPVSGELIFLDDNGRIAQVEHGGGMSTGSGWAFQNCVPQWKGEHKLLFGVRCRRVLLKDAQSKEDAGETWISEEFMVVFRDSSGNHEWRITGWELQDPSLSLFQIPDGYHVHEDEF